MAINATALFHLAMLPAEIWALAKLRQQPTADRAAVLSMTVAACGLCLIAVLNLRDAGGAFGWMALVTQGLFIHAPVWLLLTAGQLRWAWPRSARAAVLTAVSIASVGVYAFWIEPFWLEVTRLEVQSDKLHRQIRIVVLADLQTDHWGSYERRAIATAMAERPDLILMPGDYLQLSPKERRVALREEVRAYLREIGFSAPLGIYAARGDVEQRDWMELFAGVPVTPVRGTKHFDVVEELELTVLSPGTSRNLELSIPPSRRFHIVMGHAPDFALAYVGADLLIAGHTHGGQVRIPFFGPLITYSRVPRDWAAGTTDLGNGRLLVVSRGIGMERGRAPRLRLFCRPQIVVIDLVAAARRSPQNGSSPDAVTR